MPHAPYVRPRLVSILELCVAFPIDNGMCFKGTALYECVVVALIMPYLTLKVQSKDYSRQHIQILFTVLRNRPTLDITCKSSARR